MLDDDEAIVWIVSNVFLGVDRNADGSQPDRRDDALVHVAESHPRELPEHVKEAAGAESDPNRRILRLSLSAP